MPPKRPDIAALAKDTFDGREGNVHPLRGALRDENSGRIVLVPIALLEPNPDQPRKHFDPQALEDLTASIKEKGILQPIIVRQKPGSADRCIIIAGERRFRAAKAAGLTEIPTLIRSSEDSLEIALIENLQREDLNPLEEAEGLWKLKEARGYTDATLAKVVGKSRQAINDSLLLNKLPETIKAECRTSGKWTKSQLLQVLRAGSSENVQTLWHGLQAGEPATVRELRKKTAPPKGGRPQHYRFEHRPEGKPFAVTVTFTKKTATRAELRAALKDALKHLP